MNGSLRKPELPLPGCRVMLVCGPPASGKTTYVKALARADDIIIDLDEIAREKGYRSLPILLFERNERLAALRFEPRSRKAWVIICAPSKELREHWKRVLGVQPRDLILLRPTRRELIRRINCDPERLKSRTLNLDLVERWFEAEDA